MPGHIFFCMGLRCVECRASTIYWSTSLEWMAGLYGFSLPGSVVVGTVRLKWWGCGPSFFSLSSVCCQLSWRAVVCGRTLFFYSDFFWLYLSIIRGFVFYRLLIFPYLLQMVEEGNGPGGL